MKAVPIDNRGNLSLEYKVNAYIDYLVDKGIKTIHIYPSGMSARVGATNVIVFQRLRELKNTGIEIDWKLNIREDVL